MGEKFLHGERVGEKGRGGPDSWSPEEMGEKCRGRMRKSTFMSPSTVLYNIQCVRFKSPNTTFFYFSSTCTVVHSPPLPLWKDGKLAFTLPLKGK